MIVATLLACLATSPGACRTVPLPAPDEGWSQVPTGCLVEAQPMAVKWLEEHPKFVLKSIRCGRPEENA